MPELAGGPDAILVPDPNTFKILPWAEKTGWILSSMYFPSGAPCPFDTRNILKKILEETVKKDFTYVVGIEIEFFVYVFEGSRNSYSDFGQKVIHA